MSERPKGFWYHFFNALKPRDRLQVSEWADEYRFIPRGTSPEPGQWVTARTPYLKEPMDCFSDIQTETVIGMFSSQTAKSECIINVIGFFVDQDPSPILLVDPTLDMGKAFSKERIETTFAASPVLRGKLDHGKDEEASSSRKKSNTTLLKLFAGGFIAIVGANAPSGLAMRPIRIALFDEVDRFKDSIGKDGSPIAQGIQRTQNFHNRKIGMFSTPTLLGASEIFERFMSGDRRFYHVPCPHCGEKFVLFWNGAEAKARLELEESFPAGSVIWDKDESGNSLPATARIVCPHCNGESFERDKDAMLAGGEWIATQPFHSIASFHVNAIYSPWVKLKTLAEEWLTAAHSRDRKGIQEFINLKLGLPFEDDSDKIDVSDLVEKRREYYDADLPAGVNVLTAAVDTQDDRLEVEIVGWGVGKESWGIQYEVLYGDPGKQDLWNQLDELLSRTWTRVDGLRFGISCTCVDSGGHFTNEVYDYCKAREARRIYAVKGVSGLGKPIVDRGHRTDRKKNILFNAGVDSAKGTIMSRLRIEMEGPGYCHFPRQLERGYDEKFFKGLLSERLVPEFKNNAKTLKWKVFYERNEPLDLRVYNTVALEIINPNLDKPVGVMSSGPVKRAGRRVLSQGVKV